MVFVSLANAKNSKGVLKKGVSEITDKNGRIRYVSSSVVKKDEDKTKTKKNETKEIKSKVVAKEKKEKTEKKEKPEKKGKEKEDKSLTVDF